MGTHPIDLDRCFIPWTVDQGRDAEFLYALRSYGTALDWTELLKHRRVVLLAEAGSGKTTEFELQSSRLKAEGKSCFVVTLYNVAHKDFERALAVQDRTLFRNWRESGEPAWLFLDSFDEAKQANYRMVDVLREVASAIHGVEGRLHIVLSGRFSDWEFKADLHNLLKHIPVPPPDGPVSERTPNDDLIAVLNDEAPAPPPEPELPLTVLLESLDRGRVQKFATEKGVTNVRQFLETLERKNLWRLARRPIDLDWLVKYWRTKGDLAKWETMLATSIRERLQEHDSHRARTDHVDTDRALHALECIGAALVLGRIDSIRLPDTAIDLTDGIDALDLEKILPGWQPADLLHLHTRPVFEAAAPGYARLTNDNEGEVRGFLAARWLHRLRSENNCPWSRINSLLFADTYGEALVRPSMRPTVAWLSLWDPHVRNEVLIRDPQLLIDAGDPGSLPFETRVQALDYVIDRLNPSDYPRMPDRDALMRFSQPDMAPIIAQRWKQNEDKEQFVAIRELLLLTIYLGRLHDCAELALTAARAGYPDRYSPLYAGRAVTAIGDDNQKRQYVAYIVDNIASVRAFVIWDALDNLFPSHFTIGDFLASILQLPAESRDGGPGLDYYGPRLAERVQSPTDALAFRQALLPIPCASLDTSAHNRNADAEVYHSTIECIATRLLELSPADDLPIEAAAAALLIGRPGRSRISRRRQNEARAGLFAQLQRSPDRRRIALWYALSRLRQRLPSGHRIHRVWQLATLGYDPGLLVEDIPWLLEDIAAKTEPSDVEFAVHAAMDLWAQSGHNPSLLKRVQTAAETSHEGGPAIATRLNPPEPSEEEQEYERQQSRAQDEYAIETARQNQSWIDFAEQLRANPDQLRNIPSPKKDRVDGRLYHLWWLLSRLDQNQSRHAIRDLSPLRPLFGDDVINALRDAFIAYWRHRPPLPTWERMPGKRNVVYDADLIGIVGVTQEAETDREWAAKLSRRQAERAAIYATLALNGLPSWLDDLAAAQSLVVGNVLWDYVRHDLGNPDPGAPRMALQDLDNAGETVIETIAERLLDWLEANVQAPPGLVEPVLRILRRVPSGRTRVATTACRHFHESSDRNARAACFATLFVQNADNAVSMLEKALAAVDDSEQTALLQQCLSAIVDGPHLLYAFTPTALSFDGLRRFVVLAYSKVHPRDDNNRPSGVVYSPDQRDAAEGARDALLKTLAETPGLATYRTLRELRRQKDVPIPAWRMRELGRVRAENDSELDPWSPSDVLQFQSDFLNVPATAQDLQRVGLMQLGAIEHHLLHGDFNQGLVVAKLENETAVQNWFADKLQSRQGQSFTLEREPHVADEKEPDIRLSSRISDARCPIEIKIAESWSLSELRKALEDQLCHRYLRVHENRYGILLLIHQSARMSGWKCGDRFLSFLEVVDHLLNLATDLGATDSLAPQPAICVIDLSTLQPES